MISFTLEALIDVSFCSPHNKALPNQQCCKHIDSIAYLSIIAYMSVYMDENMNKLISSLHRDRTKMGKKKFG